MKTKIKHIITTVLLLLLFSLSSKGQIDVYFLAGVNEIEVQLFDYNSKLKESTTYVAMLNPESEKMKPYIEVFKKYWTISKIEFIKKIDIENYFSPGNFFITLDSKRIGEVSTHHSNASSGGMDQQTILYHNDIRIAFWAFSKSNYDEIQKKKEKKKGKKKKYTFNEFDEEYKIEIARILLYPDLETYLSDDSLNFDFDGDGHFRNCGPGFLKNQILYITHLLTQKINIKRQWDINTYDYGTCLPYYDFDELYKLRTCTLYTTDKILYKCGKFMSTKESTQNEIKLFKSYKYNYQILSTEELNQKILTDSTEFFYLLYGSNKGGRKYIWIVNSHTGEVVYSFYDLKSSRYMKPRNLKDINDKIAKGK